ncbi:FLII actin remodeling protein [Dermatophagoides pteronyssinus]|uniref:FLII actin remodeling protein n=1 Tax=Dermatophagoides pteronyssinus TaxID=6956 RepID=UPI003F6808FD
MASTRVLPFVRGIDFSHNNFEEEKFPKEMINMTGLRWLKLDSSQIDWVPEEMATMNKLESISLAKNNLVTLHGELSSLKTLRSLVLRHNRINNNGIPVDLFKLDELFVLDLSHNCLKSVPEDLEKCRTLLVLNLSNNQIDTIPNPLFINLTDLLNLDLSNNNLVTLPPQMRRLVNLQVLNLSNNPLGHNQLKQLQSLHSLQSLNLSNTQRSLHNMPTSLDNLVNLTELNLSSNDLHRMPDVVYTLSSLKRLNLSDNQIVEISSNIDQCWVNLEVLNLSRNRLKALPQSLSKLERLRCLYLNDNELIFDGIPNSIGKLYNLEIFMASNNNLELIPEGVVRCGKLKKLILSKNKLVTLPDAIYFLTDLKVLDLADNPDLILPPKPAELKENNKNIYNIDFNINSQFRNASANYGNGLNQMNSSCSKDPIARKLRLVRRAKEMTNESDSSKVLKAMTELAKENENIDAHIYETADTNLKPKRWEESLEKPPLDYSDYFEDDVGQFMGILVWEIDNFYPSRLDEACFGKFYEADCYIILKTFENENQNPDWDIYYWIGSETSLDKKACAAIHAVNLRNYLSAKCRTIREEQGEESEQFLSLFPEGITYIKGGRTLSGFYTVEEVAVAIRLYRLHEVSNQQLYMESVAVNICSLDTRFVFILDTGYKIYVWNGKRSKNTVKQKARLLVEKIKKEERKNKTTLEFVDQYQEPEEFWTEFDNQDITNIDHNFLVEGIEDFRPTSPVLYQVCLGTGYLELPQIRYKPKQLSKSHFESKNVYIMDIVTDVYIWVGRKSARLVRAAALKLAQELFAMIKRPEYAMVTRCLEGVETQSFKSRFATWDEIVAVDFTRTAKSVQQIGADMNKWLSEHSDFKYDLNALFMPRQPIVPKTESLQLAQEWNEDLINMEAFVLENKTFKKLPEEELGHFFAGECYFFLCRYYWIPDTESHDGEEEEDDLADEDAQFWIVYFWQGREASNMGWLTFTFTVQSKFEAWFKDKLKIIRFQQQQENAKFLSHFKRKFVIHSGRRDLNRSPSERLIRPGQNEFYHLRSNCDMLTLRTIQLNLDKPAFLYSAFTYILKIESANCFPSDNHVFIWVGSAVDDDDVQVAKEIVSQMYPSEKYPVTVINEGFEPELFKQQFKTFNIDTDCSFMSYSRLFRCSNDKGYFTVSEKCSDFCQDDLVDEDIMILDNGVQVFIWLGSRCSEMEVKLAYKSAQVYVQNMKLKQPERPRTLMLTLKGKETRKFSKCFHGWSQFKSVNDPRIQLDQKMLPIIYEHTNFYQKSKTKNDNN